MISSDIVLLVSTMVLVLKMLYNRPAHLSVYTAQLFMRICVYGDGLLCEKAPETIDTQLEQYGNFVKHGGATPHLKDKKDTS